MLSKGVRLAPILALTACLPGAAQMIVNPNRVRRSFDAKPGEAALRCEVSAVHPTLNYGFRYQAGYRASASMSLYRGTGHVWSMLTRITPREGERRPVFLLSNIALPEIPETKMDLQVGGAYLLGEGSYDVAFLLVDDADRVCRKQWRVDVHPNRNERAVKVAMPPATVWDLSLRGARRRAPDPDDVAPLRLTILLNAAPMSLRRTRLRPPDVGTLVSSVSSLLERVPTRGVRLVAFNLEQQKELYRKDDFHLENLSEVSQAMNGIELQLVDYKVLQNRRGHVDLLADLVNQEIAADPPSDVVLFMGPTSHYADRMPAASLEHPQGRAPQFLGFQLVPFGRIIQAPLDAPGPEGGPRGPYGRDLPAPNFPGLNQTGAGGLPDVIHSAIARLGGKTVVVHSPAEFAKAIDRLEKMGQSPAPPR